MVENVYLKKVFSDKEERRLQLTQPDFDFLFSNFVNGSISGQVMFRDEQIGAGYLPQVVTVFFLCRLCTVFLHSPLENMLKSYKTGILSLREKLLRADRNRLKYYSLNTHNFH